MKNAKIDFVLGGSGHVAGVINHPSKEKYGYAINGDLTLSSDEWQEKAIENKGSWWIHWHEWLASKNETLIPARSVGSAEYPVLCDAPGAYAVKSCE
jgi:polyhydroxyalkanoate synthase